MLTRYYCFPGLPNIVAVSSFLAQTAMALLTRITFYSQSLNWRMIACLQTTPLPKAAACSEDALCGSTTQCPRRRRADTHCGKALCIEQTWAVSKIHAPSILSFNTFSVSAFGKRCCRVEFDYWTRCNLHTWNCVHLRILIAVSVSAAAAPKCWKSENMCALWSGGHCSTPDWLHSGVLKASLMCPW